MRRSVVLNSSSDVQIDSPNLSGVRSDGLFRNLGCCSPEERLEGSPGSGLLVLTARAHFYIFADEKLLGFQGQ